MAFEVKRRPDTGGRPGETVHVIPLGWERDRAATPFLPRTDGPPHFKAHRVVLVVPNIENAKGFPEKVREQLDGICRVDIETVKRREEGFLVEFEELVAAISEILAREIWNGNQVFVNISAGSKMAAFAAGLASMAYIKPDSGGFYYVDPESYVDDPDERDMYGMARGIKDVKMFEPIPIGAPTMPRLHLLRYLWEKGGQLGYTKIIHFLKRVPDSGFEDLVLGGPEAGTSTYVGGNRSADAAAKMKLHRGFLVPLEDEGYLHVKKVGRKRIVTLLNKGKIYGRLAPPTELLPSE